MRAQLMVNSQGPISVPAHAGLTDEQVLDLFAGGPPDAFSVLSRRAKKVLSDDSVARMLVAGGASPPLPIPVATQASVPPTPLEYAPDPLHMLQFNPACAPLAYRVLRVGLWLSVAAAMVAVMLASFLDR
jgi:hypothetical protein